MSTQAPLYNNPEFDQYAEDYDAALAKGLSVSGESKDYFAEGRAKWLGQCLQRLRVEPDTILDFGCGTGSATPYLLKLTGAKKLVGVEVSLQSIKVAERIHGAPNVQFKLSSEYQPNGEIALAFCNGVFHHIPLSERPGAVKYVFDSLRPGGFFALWENNPWNPGTRYVMSRIPFDKDAITLSFLETKRLLRSAGFGIERTDFLFIFPRSLSVLRPFEGLVRGLPVGAQYQVLARKPPG
ncbi:MAG TPA: class I SAM-dependent methyltransferase [Verrucomicrobiae bacterium]|jgi:SAM-dependent methyltransferase|nr:class I SAM-dependent methyltransferase [Verrucomicrobiae bacterium]